MLVDPDFLTKVICKVRVSILVSVLHGGLLDKFCINLEF